MFDKLDDLLLRYEEDVYKRQTPPGAVRAAADIPAIPLEKRPERPMK